MLEACSYIDAIAVDVVITNNDIAQIDANSKPDSLCFGCGLLVGRTRRPASPIGTLPGCAVKELVAFLAAEVADRVLPGSASSRPGW